MRPSAPAGISRRLTNDEVLNGMNPFSNFQRAIGREARKLGGFSFVTGDEIQVIAALVAAEPQQMTVQAQRKELQVCEMVVGLILENTSEHFQGIIEAMPVLESQNPFQIMATLEQACQGADAIRPERLQAELAHTLINLSKVLMHMLLVMKT
eukprot:TRINITY_DN6935_c0_g1_i1.p4 TRINITY_DN6935_c0_g1~~TRINITY_DN6935_c0_g1_i1.p4  ORF type:complete len:153 (-),score=39.96 TRINITY_DN6935_c0_g1_i1:2393-2851(-)